MKQNLLYCHRYFYSQIINTIELVWFNNISIVTRVFLKTAYRTE